MVRVRHVRMAVPLRLVPMPVAVLADGHRVVRVCVVPVVMPVRVFVFERIVLVLVCVRFRQVQHDAGQHQQAAEQHHCAERAVTETDSASAAPMNGANANTEPVRAAPKARCASR